MASNLMTMTVALLLAVASPLSSAMQLGALMKMKDGPVGGDNDGAAPASSSGGGAGEGSGDTLPEEEYRKAYEFGHDLVKEFEGDSKESQGVPEAKELGNDAEQVADAKEQQGAEATPEAKELGNGAEGEQVVESKEHGTEATGNEGGGGEGGDDEYLQKKQEFDALLGEEDDSKVESALPAAAEEETKAAPGGDRAFDATPGSDEPVEEEEEDADEGADGDSKQEEASEEQEAEEEEEQQQPLRTDAEKALEAGGADPAPPAADKRLPAERPAPEEAAEAATPTAATVEGEVKQEERTAAEPAGNRTAGEGDENARQQVQPENGEEERTAVAEPSSRTGCFVRTLRGCPNHPSFASGEWRHEEYGERHANARSNRTVCEVDRRAHVAHWCGSEDVEMLFVSTEEEWKDLEAATSASSNGSPQAAGVEDLDAATSGSSSSSIRNSPRAPGVEDPVDPGCFVRTPSGCPLHPNFASVQWKHEEYGEKNTRALTSRRTCEVNRKASVARFCGVADVEALFMPPLEPGCHFRLPTGCPQHPTFGNRKVWEHDKHGEEHDKAREDRSKCEVSRKEHIAHWCGTQDVLVRFVPAGGALAPRAALPATAVSPATTQSHANVESPAKVESPAEVAIPAPAAAAGPGTPTTAATAAAATSRAEAAAPEGAVQKRASPGAVAVPPPLPKSRAEGLIEPGCYVRTPKGCPSHPTYSSSTWKHEEVGEKKTAALRDRTVCEKSRKAVLSRWCGSFNVEMLFVAAADVEPGCYVRTPSPAGCPLRPSYSSAVWKHEEHGEKFSNAKTNRAVCEEERRAHVAHWCGSEAVEMRFVAAPPEQPALVAEAEDGDEQILVAQSRTRAAGAEQPQLHSEQELQEAQQQQQQQQEQGQLVAEEQREAVGAAAEVASDEKSQPAEAQQEGANGSSVADAGALVVEVQDGQREGIEAEPGCLVRMPTGCPNAPGLAASAAWMHDVHAERYTIAGQNRSACEGRRRQELNQHCGTTDVETLFVAARVEAALAMEAEASEAGCFVRMPWGCPNHPGFSSVSWKHDEHGEEHSEAKADRAACEVDRAAHIKHYCGTEEVEMLFLPAAAPAAPAALLASE